MKYKDNNFYSYIFHVIILTALHFEALTFKYRHLNLYCLYCVPKSLQCNIEHSPKYVITFIAYNAL